MPIKIRRPKSAVPVGHVSPKRWAKYVNRNPIVGAAQRSAAKRHHLYRNRRSTND